MKPTKYSPQQQRPLCHFLEQPSELQVLRSLFCFGSILPDLGCFPVDQERKSISDQSKKYIINLTITSFFDKEYPSVISEGQISKSESFKNIWEFPFNFRSISAQGNYTKMKTIWYFVVMIDLSLESRPLIVLKS